MTAPFPGQYADAETGFNYNYFRDYDPTTGRYIESDPIGLYGGLNTFSYVNVNPYKWSDPLGLWTPGGHTDPTEKALGAKGFCKDDITRAATRNVDRDKNQFNDALHYAPGSGSEAEQIIANQLQQAIQSELAGDHAGAMDALGKGLHTVQDNWAHNKQDAYWPEHNWFNDETYTAPDNPNEHPNEYANALHDSKEYVDNFLKATNGIGLCRCAKIPPTGSF